eukprot:gene80-3473_t
MTFRTQSLLVTLVAAPADLTLGDQLNATEFLNSLNIEHCAEIKPSSSGFYFEDGYSEGIKSRRCDFGGMCRCRALDTCEGENCIKVWPCTVDGGATSEYCVSVTDCVQESFDTIMEVSVQCSDKPLDERNTSELDEFGMAWKLALSEDCGINRLCRYLGDRADTLDVTGTSFRTRTLNPTQIANLIPCVTSGMQIGECTVEG